MMNIEFITAIILDGAFAAIAAIGFAIISNPPRKAILISAFLAAVGHGLRYFLMHTHLFTMDIATASFFAAVSIGLLAIPCQGNPLSGGGILVPVSPADDSGNVRL